MKIGIISFSTAGERLGALISQGLKAEIPGAEIETATKSKYAAKTLDISHVQWTKERFEDSQAIVFIGACGIAVRSIAPFVKSKKTDPAVVVVDDMGKFAISLLSGHLGGGNDLARMVSTITGATAVITTATDIHEKLSPDMLAKKNNCVIDSMVTAKELAAAILEGEQIGLTTEFPFSDDNIFSADKTNKGIVISPFAADSSFFEQTLWLIPRAVFLGIGCKKGTPAEKIAAAADRVLAEYGVDERSVAMVASIDLKAEEAGLLEFCSSRGLGLMTFSGEELAAVEGEFCKSDFVREITGVDNVCERSAALAAEKNIIDGLDYSGADPEIIISKQSMDGVTVAAAMKKWRISIE